MDPLMRALAPAGRIPGASFARQRVRRAIFCSDLRRLHDVLATSALAGRYSVCGGLLLGWARDRGVLLEDAHDADFTYLAEDAAAFQSAASRLAEAGFEPSVRFVNNDGEPVQHGFTRHGARFEFFALARHDGRLRYFMYDGTDELVCERVSQPAVPFSFLGRVWLKPADHDAALTANYGAWRTSRPQWHFAEAGTVIDRRPAVFGAEAWEPIARRGEKRPDRSQLTLRTDTRP